MFYHYQFIHLFIHLVTALTWSGLRWIQSVSQEHWSVVTSGGKEIHTLWMGLQFIAECHAHPHSHLCGIFSIAM